MLMVPLVPLTRGRLPTQRSCCCHPSHSSLHCLLPMTTQLWNPASNSPCQELQTFWVPTFYSSLKGPHSAACLEREVEGPGMEAPGGRSRKEARSEPHLALSHHFPIILPSLARAPPLYQKPLYLPRPFSGASFRPSLVSSLESVYPSV